MVENVMLGLIGLLGYLAFQGSDNDVFGVEGIAEHVVLVVNRRRRPRGATPTYHLVCVLVYILHRW